MQLNRKGAILRECIGSKMRVHLSYRENNGFCYNSGAVFIIFKIRFQTADILMTEITATTTPEH